MYFKTRISTTLFLLLTLLITINTNAESAEESWQNSYKTDISYNKHQLAIEFGYRIDDQSNTDLPMQYSAQYLGFFTRHLAFQFKVGFADGVSFDDRTDGRSYTYTFGFRLQQPERVVTPFTEFGLGLQRAVGNIDGNSYSESRLGIHLGLGLSIKHGSKNHFDFGVNQLLNGFGPQPVFAPLPPEFGGPFKRNIDGSFARELFGPAYMYVRYRFSL